ncbi:MAG: CPBP family intramembrane metalloprotease [Clostridiales bacterium]|nr:CPBP family intramembrane metalloprotease [Candidatus Cacconaster stercorequi]
MALFDVLSIVLIVIWKKEFIKEEWLLFIHESKRSKTKKFLWLIPYYLLSAVLNGICSRVIDIQILSEPMNESGLDALQFSGNLWISTIITILIVILAPIIEEVVFRLGLFKPLSRKSKVLAYIISSMAFGLLHVLGPVVDGYPSQMWYIIPYGISGFFYAKYYEKCGNIYYPIILHSFSNIIASIL